MRCQRCDVPTVTTNLLNLQTKAGVNASPWLVA